MSASPGCRSVRRAAILSVLFVAVAPGTVVLVAPWLIARWFPEPSFDGPWRWSWLLLVVPGAAILVDSVARFVGQGRGTPAPMAPPERLVVSGLYRHVRNPMYVGIVATLLGEALLYGTVALLAYTAAVWLAFHLFVTLYEEPHLRRRFGAGYEAYARTVPRWVPRPTPGVTAAPGRPG